MDTVRPDRVDTVRSQVQTCLLSSTEVDERERMPESGCIAENQGRVRTRVGGLHGSAHFSVSCLLGHLGPGDREERLPEDSVLPTRGQMSPSNANASKHLDISPQHVTERVIVQCICESLWGVQSCLGPLVRLKRSE